MCVLYIYVVRRCFYIVFFITREETVCYTYSLLFQKVTMLEWVVVMTFPSLDTSMELGIAGKSSLFTSCPLFLSHTLNVLSSAQVTKAELLSKKVTCLIPLEWPEKIWNERVLYNTLSLQIKNERFMDAVQKRNQRPSNYYIYVKKKVLISF